MRMITTLVLILILSFPMFHSEQSILVTGINVKEQCKKLLKQDLLWRHGGYAEVLMEFNENIKTLPYRISEFNSIEVNGNESSLDINDINDSSYLEIRCDPYKAMFGAIIYYQQTDESILCINASLVMVSYGRVEYLDVNISVYSPKFGDFLYLGSGNDTKYLITKDYVLENGTVIIKVYAINYGGTAISTYIRIYHAFLETGYLRRVFELQYHTFENKTTLHKLEAEIPKDNTMMYFLNLSRYFRFKTIEPGDGYYLPEKNAIFFNKAGKYSIYFESFDFWNYPYPLAAKIIFKDRSGNILSPNLFEAYYQKFIPYSAIIDGYLFKRILTPLNSSTLIAEYGLIPLSILANKINITNPDIEIADSLFGVENFTIIKLEGEKYLLFRYLLPSIKRNITLRYYNYYGGRGYLEGKLPLITLKDLLNLTEYGVCTKENILFDDGILEFPAGPKGFLNLTRPIRSLSEIYIVSGYRVNINNLTVVISSPNGSIISVRLINSGDLKELEINNIILNETNIEKFSSAENKYILRILINRELGFVVVYLNDTKGPLCKVNISAFGLDSLNYVGFLFEGESMYVETLNIFSKISNTIEFYTSEEIREFKFNMESMWKTDFYKLETNELPIDTSSMVRLVVFDQFGIKIYDEIIEPSEHMEITLPVNELKITTKSDVFIKIEPFSFIDNEARKLMLNTDFSTDILYLTPGIYKITFVNNENKTRLEIIVQLYNNFEVSSPGDIFSLVDEFKSTEQIVLIDSLVSIPYPQTNITKSLRLTFVRVSDLLNSVEIVRDYLSTLNISLIFDSLQNLLELLLNASDAKRISIDFEVGYASVEYNNGSIDIQKINSLELESDTLSVLGDILKPVHITSLNMTIGNSEMWMNTTIGSIYFNREFIIFRDIKNIFPIIPLNKLNGLSIFLPFISSIKTSTLKLLDDNITIQSNDYMIICSKRGIDIKHDIEVFINESMIKLSTKEGVNKIYDKQSLVMKIFDNDFQTYKFAEVKNGYEARVKIFMLLNLYEFKLINEYTRKEVPLGAVFLYINGKRLDQCKLVSLAEEIIVDVRDLWNRTIFAKSVKSNLNIIRLKIGRIRILNKLNKAFVVKIFPLNDPNTIVELNLTPISNVEIYAPGEEYYNVSIYFTNGTRCLSKIIFLKGTEGQEPIFTILLEENFTPIDLLPYLLTIVGLAIAFTSYVVYQRIVLKKRVLVEARELLKMFLKGEIEIEEEEEKLLSKS